MKKVVTLAVSLALLGSVLSPQAFASVKPGIKCFTQGQTKNWQGKKYTCIKSGKKLVWNKGVAPKSSTTSQAPDAIEPSNPSNNNPTSTPSSTPTPNPISASTALSPETSYLSINGCKLSNGSSESGVNQSFQQNPYRVKTTKPIRALIFPIDFPDLTGSSNPQKDFASIAEGVSAYFEAMSEGRTEFKWTIHPQFVRYATKVAEANLGGRTTSGYGQFSQEALILAKQVLDISAFDLIVYAPPLTTSRDQIAIGPAFVSNSPEQINATMLDGQAYSSRFPYYMTAHEIGHLMGLADLYNYEGANESAAKPGDPNANNLQFKYMGIFDLMNWVNGDGMELSAWNRWIINLISDDQIRCLPPTTSTTLLTPVGVKGGVKGAVIPLSSTEAIVIESRRAVRYDFRLTSKSQGALVYKVNTSIRSGYGPMRVIGRASSDDILLRDAPLMLNDTLQVDGYVIEVIEKGDFGDVVRVSKR